MNSEDETESLLRYCSVLHNLLHNILLTLYVHVGTTGRYHNESLDSLTIILLYGSFLKIVISIYSLIIVYSCVLSCLLNEYVTCMLTSLLPNAFIII